MGSLRTLAGAARRRALVIGTVVGIVAGAAVGAAVLSPAEPPSLPPPQILHAAPAVVRAGVDVRLSAATICSEPGADHCRISEAIAHVSAGGSSGWAELTGSLEQGAYRFSVPASLVPDDGFSYWLEFRTRAGTSVAYPPAGENGAIRVVTTAGLVERSLPSFAWGDVRRRDGVVVRLPYGTGNGLVGTTAERTDELPSGPSSFDVGSDGSIYVVDWVNGRVQVFGPSGRFRRAVPAPDPRPLDLAVAADGRMYLTTLGLDATSYELGETGSVVGRYPVAYGVATRVAAGPEGPRVEVGPGQWTPVRSAPGVPLSAKRQAIEQTAAVPLEDGSVGVTAELGSGAFAVAWTRPDGSRAGAVVELPNGVRAGTGYFVRPLPDGGALVARGLWDDVHFEVGVLRFDARARIVAFSRLPEPSIRQSARFSTVRFREPGEVLAVYADDRAVTIERFEVMEP
jgi:hypothetical protein